MKQTNITPDGSFVFTKMLPGSYVLEVAPPGGFSVGRDIEVGPEGLSGVQINLPYVEISGRVIAGDGNALPDLSAIRFAPLGDNPVLHSYPGKDGRFTSWLAAGEYRILAEGLAHGYVVKSISDGTRDLLAAPFVFDGEKQPEIVITKGPD